MIIIAFSNKTSKIIPNIVCRKYKHVAPIVPHNDKYIMYQFISPGKIKKIVLRLRDITVLHAYGWDFLYLENKDVSYNFAVYHARTCVDFTKRIIGLKNIFIQTPWKLYKTLNSVNPRRCVRLSVMRRNKM